MKLPPIAGSAILVIDGGVRLPPPGKFAGSLRKAPLFAGPAHSAATVRSTSPLRIRARGKRPPPAPPKEPRRAFPVPGDWSLRLAGRWRRMVGRRRKFSVRPASARRSPRWKSLTWMATGGLKYSSPTSPKNIRLIRASPAAQGSPGRSRNCRESAWACMSRPVTCCGTDGK